MLKTATVTGLGIVSAFLLVLAAGAADEAGNPSSLLVPANKQQEAAGAPRPSRESEPDSAGKSADPATASSTADSAGSQVTCIEPYAACSESEKVIDALKNLINAYAHGDVEACSEYLDDQCTTFNEGTKQLIVGKENVLSDIRRKIQEHAPGGSEPLLSYTINHPYAKVTGDTAVVTFTAVKVIGGKHPYKAEVRATDVWKKHGDSWKKLHYSAKWRKIK